MRRARARTIDPLRALLRGLAVAALTAAFYLVITPIAVVLRRLRRDPLRRARDPDATTYWRRRP